MRKFLLVIIVFFLPISCRGQKQNFLKGVWGADVVDTEVCPNDNSPSTFTKSGDTVTIIIINDFQKVKKVFTIKEIIDNSLNGVIDYMLLTEDYYNIIISGYIDSGKEKYFNIKIYQQMLVGYLEQPLTN